MIKYPIASLYLVFEWRHGELSDYFMHIRWTAILYGLPWSWNSPCGLLQRQGESMHLNKTKFKWGTEYDWLHFENVEHKVEIDRW